MALFLNKLLRNSLLLQTQSAISSRSFRVTSVQQLYSPASLGIDSYLQTRKKLKEQFGDLSEKFITKMNDFVNDEKSLIFTEDLKNMVHIAEPLNLEVVVNMIHKFNSQKSEFRFGSFVFGPVVMRMFHFLDAPKEALQVFQDPVNNGFFDQLVSFQILLDLLYRNEMYDDMYKVFEIIQAKQLNMTKYPKYPVVLILAACYKQNTPKTFEYATKLWTDMSAVGNIPLRRATTFFAGLALKNGAPHIALESISSQKQHYVTLRNIKAIALAQLGRIEDVLPLLRSVLDLDSPNSQKNKHTFFEETITIVKEAVEKSNNKDAQKEFERIEKSLRDHGLIDNQTLDQLLNAEITLSPKTYRPPLGVASTSMPYHLRQSKRPNLS